MATSLRPERFDRSAARMAGYSDAEIDAFLATLGGGDGEKGRAFDPNAGRDRAMAVSSRTGRLDRLSPVASRSSTATAQLDPNTPTGRTLGGELAPIVRQVAQGATFGAADEIEAAVRAPFSPQDYGAIRDDIRTSNRTFATENPGWATGAQVAGGLLTGGAAMRAMGAAKPAATAMGRIGQAARAGATGGGLAGAASAEGDLADRAMGAATGAAGGAVFGTAIAGGGEAIRAATPFLRDLLNRVSTRGAPDQRAQRLVAQELADDGVLSNLDDVQAQLEDMRPERRVSIADLGGDNTRRLANTATLTPSEQAGALRSDLAGRASGAGRSARRSLREGAGTDGRPVAQMVDEIKVARAATTGPMYEAATQGVVPGASVAPLTKSPALRRAYARGATLAQEEGITLPSWSDLKNARDVPGEVAHFWKIGLDDEIAELARKESGGTPTTKLGQLQRRKQQLLTVIDDALPGYRDARGEYEALSRQIDAVRQGARGDASRGLRAFPNADANDVQYLLEGAPDAVREAYAKGAAAATERVVKNTRTQPQFFRAVLNDPEEQQKVRALFPPGGAGDDAFSYWLRETERDFRERLTEQAVLGNSATAGRLAAREKFGDQVADAARDVGRRGVVGTALDRGFEWYQRQRMGQAANDVAGLFRPRSPQELQEMLDNLSRFYVQSMRRPPAAPTLGPARVAAASGMALGRLAIGSPPERR